MDLLIIEKVVFSTYLFTAGRGHSKSWVTSTLSILVVLNLGPQVPFIYGLEPMLYFVVNNSALTLGAGRKAPPGIIISQSTLIEASLNFEVPNPQLKLSQSNSNQTQYLSLIVTDRQRLSLKPKQVLFFGKSFPGISRNLCRRVLLILKYKYRKEKF